MAKKIVQPVEVAASVKGDQSVKSFKTQLKEAKAEALALAAAFGETDARTLAAAQRVADLKDRMDDVNATIAGLHPDKFQRIANITSTLANGFAAAQGAAALLGSEGEDLQKAMVRVQGAMALAQGVAGLKDIQFMFAGLGTTITTKVIPSLATLRGALIATGIGAIVVAVGMLAANWDKVVAAFRRFVGLPDWEKLAAKNKAINDAMDRNIEILEARDVSETELTKARLKRLQTEYNQLRDISKQRKTTEEEQARIHEILHQMTLEREKAKTTARKERLKAEEEAEDKALKNQQAREEERKKIEQERADAERNRILKSLELLKLEEDSLQNRRKIAYLNFLQNVEQLKKIGLTEEQIMRLRDAALLKAQEDYLKEQAALDKQANDLAKAEEDKVVNDLLNARKKYYDTLELEAMQNSRNQEEIDKKLSDIKQARLQNEITILKAYGRDTVELEKQLEIEKSNIRKAADAVEDKAREERKKKNKEEAEARQRDIEMGVNAAQSMLTLFDALTTNSNAKSEEQRKREFERKKKFEMAAAIMSTVSSAQAAYQSQMASAAVGDLTAPIRASVAAATAMAQGLARVAMISKQNYQSSTPPSGGGTMSGNIAQRPSMPSTASGLGGGSQMAGQQQRIFVTESDISNVQGRVKALKAGSVI